MTLDNKKIYRLFTDGGARGNPGRAAIGGVLTTNQSEVVASFSRSIGETTNNRAEYQALIFGLQYARRKGVKKISCFLDSELVVRQLNHEYRIKDTKLAHLYAQVDRIVRAFTEVTFTSIPRAENKKADELVNKALDRI